MSSVLKGIAEVKYFDKTLSIGSSTAGTIVELGTSSISQGDLVTQRTGNLVSLINLKLRFTVKRAAAASATTIERFRIVIFQTRTSGAPTVAQLLVGLSPSSHFNPDYCGQSNADARFQVLWDSYATIDLYHAYSEHVVAVTPYPIGRVVRYDNAVADPSINGIWMMAISDAISNSSSIVGTSFVSFTDR
jgi:hypothetical protein